MFAFDDPKSFRLFMRAPNHIQKQLLNKIYTYQQWCHEWEGAIDKQILSSFKSLRAVHIVIVRDEEELDSFGLKLFAQTEMVFNDLIIGNTNLLFRTVESLSEASIVVKRCASHGLKKPTIMRQLRDFTERVEQRLLDPNDART